MRMTQEMDLVQEQGPKLLFIKKSEIPEGISRGRVSLLSRLPFWNELVDVLARGLAPSEAVEIELSPVKTAEGKLVSPTTLLSAIRHQFQKSGLTKKYSLVLRGANRLFIVDHATASHAAHA